MTRPLHLLREGIIDAWIGSYQPDLPEKNDPNFMVIYLCKNPVKLEKPLTYRSLKKMAP